MKQIKIRVLTIILFTIYCVFVIYQTIIKRQVGWHRVIKLDLFWSYRELLEGNPNGEKDVIQNLSNVAFFVPFGFLFPRKDKGLIEVAISAALFSVLIETVQYIFKLGWCELDDVICNILGALFGFLLFRLISRFFAKES